MNPLGAFSFAKIIKSLVPGTILIFYFCLLCEVMDYVSHQHHTQWLAKLVGSQAPATLFVAVLIPGALIGGFFLNTAWWLFFGKRFKARTLRMLHPKLSEAYREIECFARYKFAAIFGSELPEDTEPPELPVQTKAFLLPLLQPDKYASVNEAYFAWYEFQANSALAIGLAFVGHVCFFAFLFLTGGLPGHPQVLALLGGLAVNLVPTLLLGWFLLKAGKANLDKHHQYLLWFFIGSIDLEGEPDVLKRSRGFSWLEASRET